jgi:hypothetical protein
MAFAPISGAWYYLVAAHSDKVLEVKDAAHGNGAVLQQGDPKKFTDSDHQQFTFVRIAERAYLLRARHSQKVLDVKDASTDDGATVQQWDWHDAGQELFHVIDAGDATFYLEALHSGKVLDVAGEGKTAGTPVVQHRNHYNGKNLHQRFRPVLAEAAFAPAQLPGFTNPSQIMRDVTMGIAGLIPQAGGAVRAVVGLLWPDQNPSMIFGQVMKYIEAYVESRLQEERHRNLRAAIDGAKTNLTQFAGLEPGKEKGDKLTQTNSVLNAVDRNFFFTDAPEQTMSYLVTMGTIKLTVLQELARNLEALTTVPDTNQQQHLGWLRAGIAEYTTAAQRFRELALERRQDRIGHDFRILPTADGDYVRDFILRDAADGSETVIRVDARNESQENAARTRLFDQRAATLRAQYGAQIDAILAPALLWRSFDPEQPRPARKAIETKTGAWGNVATEVNLSGGKEISKIEVWADSMVHGLRVTNRANESQMVGAATGTLHEMQLAPEESVSGAYGSAYHYLHSLFLETSFGRRLSAGQLQTGYRFQADLPLELKAWLGNITASGGSNSVSSIQFHWKYVLEGEYPPKPATSPQLTA